MIECKTFSDFLAYHIKKYGVTDLSIGNWKVVLCFGRYNPILDVMYKDGTKQQNLVIYDNGKVAYDFFPPLYVRKHIEKSVRNMHFYFTTQHPVYVQLVNEYGIQ